MSFRTPNINLIVIGGNVVREPEVKEVGEKKTKFARISVANNRPYQDKDGKWQQEVTYVDVEVWGTQAKKIEEYCKKGTPIVAEGNLKLNKWENKEGKTFSKLLIHADKIHILDYPEKK